MATHGAVQSGHDGPAPWEVGHPQPAIKAVADAGRITGRVLDVGCGTGEHTLLAAGLGLDAVGIDLDEVALDSARNKASARGLNAQFLRFDARHLAELDSRVETGFDTVIDSELFHMLADADRDTYLSGLTSVLNPGGRYVMLGFSDSQPDVPHQLTRQQIQDTFGTGWQIEVLEPVTIDTTIHPDGARGWLLTATLLGPSRASAQTHIATPRAARYLTQICAHLQHLRGEADNAGRAHAARRPEHTTEPPRVQNIDRFDTRAVVTFDEGRCTLAVTEYGLTLVLEAHDIEYLQRMKALFKHRIERIGRRDNLQLNW